MSEYAVRRFDSLSASDEDLRVVHAFLSGMEAERNPEDPARPLEHTIKFFRNFSLLTDEKLVIFHAWHGDAIVGEAFVVVGLDEENDHLLSADLQVLEGHRRIGIGRALLRRVLQVAELENRRLILGTTDSAIPAGAEFAGRVGASVGLVEETSQLYLRDIDDARISSWLSAVSINDFRLLEWLGPYPETYLSEMAALQEVMNTAPIGDLDYEDERVTPQAIRESEAYQAARGVERWTLVAQHNESKDLAGYTEVDWHPDNPKLLLQGDTVVDPRYRQRGLGRFLKAKMIEMLREKRKQVTHVRTENATLNESMRRLNHAMGFTPLKTRTEWQLDVAACKTYLQGS